MRPVARRSLHLVLFFALAGAGCEKILGSGYVKVDGAPLHHTAGSGGPGGDGGGTSSGAAGQAGDTGEGGGVTGACQKAADCGVDTECQAHTCVGGVCGVENAPSGTAVATQTPGDCQRVECNGMGGETSVEDDSDVPDDGHACTIDACAQGTPTHSFEAEGASCSEGGGSRCDGAGSCVECLSDGDCPGGTCNAMHQCAAAQCTDGVKDGAETDVDCGGSSCPSCGPGGACGGDADCESGACLGAVCACGGTHMLISEIRGRGIGGASDEFVELFNPTAGPVTLDTSFSLQARSSSSTSYSNRWVGSGQVVPSHYHFLIAGTGYTGAVAPDDSLMTGITDATSLRLVESGAVLDAVCYAFDSATASAMMNDPTFSCEGTPVNNLPHDNTSAGNQDVSLDRVTSCADSGDNAADFGVYTPALPQNLASGPTP